MGEFLPESTFEKFRTVMSPKRAAIWHIAAAQELMTDSQIIRMESRRPSIAGEGVFAHHIIHIVEGIVVKRAKAVVAERTTATSVIATDAVRKMIRRAREKSENLGVSTVYVLRDLLNDARDAATEVAKLEAGDAKYQIDLAAPTFIGIAKVMCLSEISKGYGIPCPRDKQRHCSLVDALNLGVERASDETIHDLKQLELKIEERETPGAEDNGGIEVDIDILTHRIREANEARIRSKDSEAGNATHFVSWVSLSHNSTFLGSID